MKPPETSNRDGKFLIITGIDLEAHREWADWHTEDSEWWVLDEDRRTDRNEWRAGGLIWSFQPGRETARLGALARVGAGEHHSWDAIQSIAAYAWEEIRWIAEKRATEASLDLPDDMPAATAEAMMEMHGSAAILASALLWGMQTTPEPASVVRHK